ncbi:MAG: hypothetical protein P9L99_06635 [Candidatus Lernaella stagnicola]|nr:hypothetical protein [Candidatus Lernaella stagnicola]
MLDLPPYVGDDRLFGVAWGDRIVLLRDGEFFHWSAPVEGNSALVDGIDLISINPAS